MSFRDLVTSTHHKVFLNTEWLGELRTLEFDKETYTDVRVMLSGPKDTDRSKQSQGSQTGDDHSQGLHLCQLVLHVTREDLGGKVPKKGTVLTIHEPQTVQLDDEYVEGAENVKAGKSFRRYRVLGSEDILGMLRLELEAIRA